MTADRVPELPDRCREALGPVRTGSATDRLLTRFPDLAAFTAEDAHDDIGGRCPAPTPPSNGSPTPRSSDPSPTANTTSSGAPPPSSTNSTTPELASSARETSTRSRWLKAGPPGRRVPTAEDVATRGTRHGAGASCAVVSALDVVRCIRCIRCIVREAVHGIHDPRG